MNALLRVIILFAIIGSIQATSDAQLSAWLEDQSCNGRTLSESEAEQFFEGSRIIPGIIWIRDQIATPCQLKGITTFHGAQWKYSIYPTGMGVLRSEDLETQLFFKCETCGILDEVRMFDEYY